MPITLKYPVNGLTQDDFHDLDYRVMRTAFDIHNDFGRFLDEMVYKNELAYRLHQQGIAADREFPIELSFATFYTKRCVDLLVERAAVYEVKTASAFSPAHRSQALNYLFLTNTRHGKLVNFRPTNVKSQFISTTLDRTQRSSLEIDAKDWLEDGRSATLKDLAIQLVHDWGAFWTCWSTGRHYRTCSMDLHIRSIKSNCRAAAGELANRASIFSMPIRCGH